MSSGVGSDLKGFSASEPRKATDSAGAAPKGF